MIFSGWTLAGLLVAGIVVVLLLPEDDAASSPPLDGCHEVQTRELYVAQAYACDDGTRVVTFADDRVRDDYIETAERFGTVIVDRGPRWTRVR